MQYVRYLFAMIALPTILMGGMTIEQIKSEMTAEQLQLSGLGKLTEEEAHNLDLWLLYEAPSYYNTTSRKRNYSDIRTLYKTETFRYPKSPADISYIDESSHEWEWPLALASVFQNEGPYLKEFIEYYKMMGVQHFFLYNNMSNDNYYQVLEEYIDRGEVELFEWPVENYVYGQCPCFSDAVERARGKAKWLVVADPDIYLFPLEKGNLIDFLQEYEAPHIGGVSANTHHFGTNGVTSLNQGDLMIDLLDRRHPDLSDHVRSIVKPHKVWYIDNPHFAHYLPGYYGVDEEGRQVDLWLNKNFPCSKILANHYNFRTKDHLYSTYAIRHARFAAEQSGVPKPTVVPHNREALDKADETYSQVLDQQIKRFIPALRARMGGE